MILGSLAGFRQMKYNEPKEFDLLTDYKNSVENGMISPLSGFKNYKKIAWQNRKEYCWYEDIQWDKNFRTEQTFYRTCHRDKRRPED